MASSKETYCLCGQPYNVGQFMIECDCCREWFHGSCVNVKIYHSDDIDKYHCPKCEPTYGPSVSRIPTNNHRADRYEIGAETRPSQAGTPAWVRALAARPLRPTQAALQRIRPEQFTEEFVQDNGFTKPIMFHSNEGLDMKVPNSASFNVRSVLRFCGAQLEVEVIDVRKQSTLRMPLSDFVEYFETLPEHRDDKVLNVLSLEFSETNMSPLVEPPGLARCLDWAERVWAGGAPEGRPKPAVQKYCLMSAGGSYTDYHVDFGGTTVWYHVMHGRKIFYLVPPTSTNLALYQQWSAANNQNERFFGDMVEWYGTAELCAGETLFIPSGWIHAVYTPSDSLVFGGNLLHSYAIEMQLQIYEIESRVETPTMFRYPLFEAMHWYAGAHLLAMLRRHNEETQDEDFTLSESYIPPPQADLPPLLLRGIKILSNALKEWHALKSTDTSKRDNVPKCLNSGQLVRELCKELRILEKRSGSSKDKDNKVKNTSPTKPNNRKQQHTQKKSLKLTLPKPIMHMTPNTQNGDYIEEKLYADKFYIDNKEVAFTDKYSTDIKYVADTKYASDVKYVTDGKYVTDTKYVEDAKYVTDAKYVNSDVKYVIEKEVSEKFYQNYEVAYQDNGYTERHEKKIVKAKISPSSSQEPPPYSLPEHSILKSHLIRSDRLKPIQQWTISKKDIGDYHEEVLYTNDNLQANIRLEGQEISYGPGMYSAEDIQQDYQYSETAKPGSYQQYGIQPATEIAYDTYQRYTDVVPAHQGAAYSTSSTQSNGVYVPTPAHTQLPSYETAIAHQYQYVIQEPKAQESTPVTPVRRSERAVRRRMSNTYEYEDGDLYVDEPAPARRRPTKHRHNHRQHSASSASAYRSRPAPVNGIESLIQASVLAEGEQPVTDTEDAAVAGMLSISERFEAQAPRSFDVDTPERPSPNERLAESSSTPTSSKRARKTTTFSADEDFDDEEDIIKEVHRDEEYVYPSLEMSSDDDDDWTTTRRRRSSKNRSDSRAKGEKDESWSPRARLGRLVPRLRGPARSSVRRECVRAALHAASQANTAVDKVPLNPKRAVLATKSRRPPPPVHNPANNKNLRLKKGMKTAKQRLGKILKIHKMIY